MSNADAQNKTVLHSVGFAEPVFIHSLIHKFIQSFTEAWENISDLFEVLCSWPRDYTSVIALTALGDAICMGVPSVSL